MKNLLPYLIIIAVPSISCAQHISYGVEGRINRSTQVVFNPQLHSGGSTQMNPLSGLYAGAYVSTSDLFHNKILDFFTYKTRLAYARRGSSLPVQISESLFLPGSADSTTVITVTKNTLNYVCLDLLLQKEIFQLGKKLSLSLEGGFAHNLLISGAVKTTANNGYAYPYNRYTKQALNRYTISWIAGLGVNIDDKFSLFIESDKALTPVYSSADLSVKGWSWSLGASIKVGNFKLHREQI